MIQWHLEVIPIKSLKPNPKNPRQITKDQMHHLENLIDKFGLIDKPIINKDFTIIGGHQRIKVLKRKKVKTVECWVPDDLIEEADLERLMIGLNLNQGAWDYDILANEFDALKLLEYGFTEEQLLGKIDDIEQKEGEEEKKYKTKVCPHCGLEI